MTPENFLQWSIAICLSLLMTSCTAGCVKEILEFSKVIESLK